MKIEITIKDHRFSPSEIHLPAGKPTLLTIKNEDCTAEEFDSSALKMRRSLRAALSATVRLRPLGARPISVHGRVSRRHGAGRRDRRVGWPKMLGSLAHCFPRGDRGRPDRRHRACRHQGVARRGLWVVYGVIGGVAGACLVAAFAGEIASLFEGSGQELFNASILTARRRNADLAQRLDGESGRAMAHEMRKVGARTSWRAIGPWRAGRSSAA